MSVYIIMGIGVDDAYIFLDAYKQISMADFPLEKRLSVVRHHSTHNILCMPCTCTNLRTSPSRGPT